VWFNANYIARDGGLRRASDGRTTLRPADRVRRISTANENAQAGDARGEISCHETFNRATTTTTGGG